MADNRQSESLFTTSSKKSDVRHDISKVQQRWDKESRRRTVRILWILLVVFILAIMPVYLWMAYNDETIVGARIFQHNREIVDPMVHEPCGNPEAKVVIEYVPEILPRDFTGRVYMAVDHKPSEIYIKPLNAKGMDKEEIKEKKNSRIFCMTINGQSCIKYVNYEGQEREIDLSKPSPKWFSEEEAMCMLEYVHDQFYPRNRYRLFGSPAPLYNKEDSAIKPVEPIAIPDVNQVP